MPPPDEKTDTKVKKNLDYLNSVDQKNETPTVISVHDSDEEANEEVDTGVTYFVDEEGRYYYQTNAAQNLVSLSTEDQTRFTEEMTEQARLLAEGENYQTVTFMPDESGGEVSYVLVMQEETKPDISNIKVDNAKVENVKVDNVKVDNIKVDKIKEEKNNDDVYNFDEEEANDDDDSDDDDRPKVKSSSKSKRGKYARPQFKCNFCSYTSHRRYLLLRHMKSHSEERPHKCNVCERGFKTLASLQNHVNMHNGVKPHICKYCKSPFTTSGELVRHVRYRHTHEKPHKCTECDYASVELSKLRRHVRCHTGERPYQCPHCTYASQDTFKLKRHLRTHTGEKPYKCDSCNLCFTQSNSLKAHKLIHNVSQKPVFKCELCPAKCGRKTDLRIHVQKLHTSDKPLKCKRCGKTFPDRYSCKMHIKTHEGEKCFKCDLCSYASTTLRHLKSHMLKHTDEKPFSCDECDQSFRQKQLLRRHQNLYHNPNYEPKPPKEKTHTCHACKRTFAHKGNLIRHLAVHDPESEHHERSPAHRLGRPKKMRLLNADIKSEEPETHSQELMKMNLDHEMKQEEIVEISDDEQQYVVLEVIHLEDGTEQQVAVMAPDYIHEQDVEDEEVVEDEEELVEVEEEEEDQDEEEDEDEDEDEEEEEEEEEDDKKQKIIAKGKQDLERCIKLKKEVNTCFGFDEDESEEEEKKEKITYKKKMVLRID